MLLVALVLFFSKDMIGNHHQSELEKDRNKSFITIEKEEIKNDSLPYRRESITIQKKTDDQDVKISMENGKVTNLEIDGKKIDEKEYDKYKDIIADVKPRSKSFGNSHMYFFGDKGDDPLMLDFNNKFQLDSMMKGFEIKGFGNINYGTPEIREKMAKLKDQMGKLKFNFKGLDSINFNFEGFPDSEFDIIGDLPRMMKFYDFDGESNDTPEDMFRFKGKKDMNISDVIGNSLNRDGLLIPDQENSVELTGKYLKINGEKQPSNIWNKYKRIFEEQSGAVLQKNSNLEFKFEGKDSKIKYRVY